MFFGSGFWESNSRLHLESPHMRKQPTVVTSNEKIHFKRTITTQQVVQYAVYSVLNVDRQTNAV